MPSMVPKGYKGFDTLNPIQKRIMEMISGSGGMGQNPLAGQVNDYYSSLLDNSNEAYENFAAPHMRQFNEQTIPGLAERFAGLGAQSSSGFQNALGQAGAGLQENLAGLRSGLQMQGAQGAGQFNQQNLQNLMQLLGVQTQGIVPKQPGFLQSLLTSLSGGLGQGIGSAGGMWGMSKFLPKP